MYKKLCMTCRPSVLLGELDSYTAFCFDEVCAYILTRIDNGDKLKSEENKHTSSQHFNKPSDFFGKFE